MKILCFFNASQVGATDQLGNGYSLAGQTDELSSSKQENRTFLSGKVKVLTRGFVSEQSIAVSLNRHLRGATKKIFLSKKIADMKNIKRLLLSEEETTVKEVNLLNQANASQIGATVQLVNGNCVDEQITETTHTMLENDALVCTGTNKPVITVNTMNVQTNASQVGATEQLDNGKSVVDQTIETSCSVEEENYTQIQTADGLVVQQTTDEVQVVRQNKINKRYENNR